MAGYRVWYTWLCTYDEDRGDDVTCILMARKGPKEGTLAITLSIERSDPDALATSKDGKSPHYVFNMHSRTQNAHASPSRH